MLNQQLIQTKKTCDVNSLQFQSIRFCVFLFLSFCGRCGSCFPFSFIFYFRHLTCKHITVHLFVILFSFSALSSQKKKRFQVVVDHRSQHTPYSPPVLIHTVSFSFVFYLFSSYGLNLETHLIFIPKKERNSLIRLFQINVSNRMSRIIIPSNCNNSFGICIIGCKCKSTESMYCHGTGYKSYRLLSSGKTTSI